MARQEGTSEKKSAIVPIIQAVVPVIGVIAVAYFGYLGIYRPRQLEIQAEQTAQAIAIAATQTAEAKETQTAEAIAVISTDTSTLEEEEPSPTDMLNPTATFTNEPTPTSTEAETPTQPTSTPIPIYTPIVADTPPTMTVAGAQWRRDKDDAVYVFVPAGEFIMGEGDDVRSVDTDGFWIMQTEVTNALYAQCVEADACTEPNNERWKDSAYAGHPVTDVNWVQANKYSAWVGGRLPTEVEWEKACRGTDGRVYPWGNEEPNEDLANFNQYVGDTTPVGIYSDGASPYGALDMAGNVWEWTDSWYGDKQEQRALRGGYWRNVEDLVRCSHRFRNYTDFRNFNGGFRVASPGS